MKKREPFRVTVPAELAPYLQALGDVLWGSAEACAVHLIRSQLIDMSATPGFKALFDRVRAEQQGRPPEGYLG